MQRDDAPVPELILSGVRAALLRSALVGWLACAGVALVASLVPAYREVTEVVEAGGIRESVVHARAGTPLELITLVSMVLLAALGAALPRREVTTFVAGVLTVAAFPLGIALAGRGGPGRPLPVVHLLDTCLGALMAAGPSVAGLGAVLYLLERRARARRPLPVAQTR